MIGLLAGAWKYGAGTQAASALTADDGTTAWTADDTTTAWTN